MDAICKFSRFAAASEQLSRQIERGLVASDQRRQDEREVGEVGEVQCGEEALELVAIAGVGGVKTRARGRRPINASCDDDAIESRLDHFVHRCVRRLQPAVRTTSHITTALPHRTTPLAQTPSPRTFAGTMARRCSTRPSAMSATTIITAIS